MKYKTGLVKEVREKKEFDKKQEVLRDKYSVDNSEILVVEKNHFLKFSIRLIIASIKMLATILILCMAMVGLCALIYPGPRKELIHIFSDAIIQVKGFI